MTVVSDVGAHPDDADPSDNGDSSDVAAAPATEVATDEAAESTAPGRTKRPARRPRRPAPQRPHRHRARVEESGFAAMDSAPVATEGEVEPAPDAAAEFRLVLVTDGHPDEFSSSRLTDSLTNRLGRQADGFHVGEATLESLDPVDEAHLVVTRTDADRRKLLAVTPTAVDRTVTLARLVAVASGAVGALPDQDPSVRAHRIAGVLKGATADADRFGEAADVNGLMDALAFLLAPRSAASGDS